MAQSISAFLDRLFGGKAPDDYLLIWTLQTKKSFWYRNIKQAAVQAQVLSKSGDVYVGVGLAPHAYGDSLRCPSEDVVGLAGLWADIDVLDPVHKKQNLPPTIEAAVALCESMPVPPTLVVHSGHGIQAWWLFDQVWDLRLKGERERAQRLSRNWSHHLKGLARAQGWECDSVYDLARILRIPGTLNHKNTDHIVEVQLLSDSTVRYATTSLEGATPISANAESNISKTYSTKIVGDLTLDPDVALDQFAFDLLVEVEPRFIRSFKRQHRDELVDNSPSEHDLAIANFAAQAGWSNQEIANLLICARRENGEDVAKALRADYIGETIAKARDSADKYHGIGAYSNAVQGPSHRNGRMAESGPAVAEDPGSHASGDTGSDQICPGGNEAETDTASAESDRRNHRNGTAGQSLNGTATRTRTEKSKTKAKAKSKNNEDDDDDENVESRPFRTKAEPKLTGEQLEQTLRIASAMVGVQVISVRKFIGTNPSYHIQTAIGEATFKNVAELQNQTTFRNKIYGSTNYLFPPLKTQKWIKLMNYISAVADQVDTGDEGTAGGLMRSWISSYIRTHEPLDEGDPMNDSPFYAGSFICIYNDHFRRWLSMQYGEKLTYQDLGTNFRAIDAEPGSIQISLKNGKKTFRPLWKVPESFILGEKDES